MATQPVLIICLALLLLLRELVSNGSDALDKIRYASLTDPSALDLEKELYIRIIPDKENKPLIIRDTGVGMTKADMVNNLGTITKSGTKGFMEVLSSGADISMIGQFSVGFYSAYLVAERVQVILKHNDDEEYIWESAAGGTFITPDTVNPPLGRGTELHLYLKEDRHSPHRTQAPRRQDGPHQGSSAQKLCISWDREHGESKGSLNVSVNRCQLDLLPSSSASPTRPPIWCSARRRQRLHHRILLFLRSVRKSEQAGRREGCGGGTEVYVVMLNLPEDVTSLLSIKLAVKYALLREVESMRAIARVHQNRNLADFEKALKDYKDELSSDPTICSHLAALYNTLLEQNLLWIIEPYLVVEIEYVAQQVGQGQQVVEPKLSQMILDKVFHGVLDQGRGCLLVFDEPEADNTYSAAINTLEQLGKVVYLLEHLEKKIKRTPFDLFETKKKCNNIKLCVRHVFIMDNCEDIIPEYLSFVKGIVNSEDLPLNISRETLQRNEILKVIRKNIMNLHTPGTGTRYRRNRIGQDTVHGIRFKRNLSFSCYRYQIFFAFGNSISNMCTVPPYHHTFVPTYCRLCLPHWTSRCHCELLPCHSISAFPQQPLHSNIILPMLCRCFFITIPATCYNIQRPKGTDRCVTRIHFFQFKLAVPLLSERGIAASPTTATSPLTILMGVNGLWRLLAPAAENRSFTELTIAQFEQQSDAYILGVDASIWLVQCCAVFHYSHHNAGENPELRTLFYRLCRLFRLHALVIFVFDGMQRTEIKRGKKAKKTPHWIEGAFIEMVKLFGFSVHRAPAEAEAELAWLNRSSVINAVLTDDVDTFIFGAFTIIRNPTTKNENENVKLFTAGTISQVMHLTRGGMILIALLRGGDYDKIGLKGCGINVAYGLAKYDLGESLLKAAKWHHDDPAALAKFLVDWRAELRQLLRTDPDGHIGRRCSTLANRVSEDFPDVPVIFAYTHPLTSWSHGRSGTNVIPDISTQQLDLRGLATFCSRRFGWCPQKVHHKFESVIWQGVCVRVLAQGELKKSPHAFSPACVLKVITRRTLSASGRSVILYRLNIEGKHLVALVEKGISDAASTSVDVRVPGAITETNVWVPLPIVRHATPHLVKKGDGGPAHINPPPETIIDLTGVEVDIVVHDMNGQGVGEWAGGV